MQEMSNHPLYQRFEGKFKRESAEEEILRIDALNFFTDLLSEDLDLKKMDYDILGVNIDSSEPQLLQKIACPSTNIFSLFSWLLMSEKGIPDIHRFILALYHLYHEIIEEQEEIDQAECGAVIQLACSLFENSIKKAYWIQKGGFNENDLITLHPLIQNVLKFGASKGARKGKKLVDWQILIVWGYELRNSFAHELHNLPLDQFKLTYKTVILSLIYGLEQIINKNQKWFMSCSTPDDPTWLTIQWRHSGSTIWCPKCDKDVLVKL